MIAALPAALPGAAQAKLTNEVVCEPDGTLPLQSCLFDCVICRDKTRTSRLGQNDCGALCASGRQEASLKSTGTLEFYRQVEIILSKIFCEVMEDCWSSESPNVSWTASSTRPFCNISFQSWLLFSAGIW